MFYLSTSRFLSIFGSFFSGLGFFSPRFCLIYLVHLMPSFTLSLIAFSSLDSLLMDSSAHQYFYLVVAAPVFIILLLLSVNLYVYHHDISRCLFRPFRPTRPRSLASSHVYHLGRTGPGLSPAASTSCVRPTPLASHPALNGPNFPEWFFRPLTFPQPIALRFPRRGAPRVPVCFEPSPPRSQFVLICFFYLSSCLTAFFLQVLRRLLSLLGFAFTVFMVFSVGLGLAPRCSVSWGFRVFWWGCGGSVCFLSPTPHASLSIYFILFLLIYFSEKSLVVLWLRFLLLISS